MSERVWFAVAIAIAIAISEDRIDFGGGLGFGTLRSAACQTNQHRLCGPFAAEDTDGQSDGQSAWSASNSAIFPSVRPRNNEHSLFERKGPRHLARNEWGGRTALRKTLSTLQKCRSASHRSSPSSLLLLPLSRSRLAPRFFRPARARRNESFRCAHVEPHCECHFPPSLEVALG